LARTDPADKYSFAINDLIRAVGSLRLRQVPSVIRRKNVSSFHLIPRKARHCAQIQHADAPQRAML
jgi:hypothetical protein